MLLRHYIRQRMIEYYSQPATAVVGGLMNNTTTGTGKNNHNIQTTTCTATTTKKKKNDSIVSFQWLFGEWDWKRRLKQLYVKQHGQWLTPVELFQPYYSNCIANYVYQQTLKQQQQSQSLTKNEHQSSMMIDIIEIGGGRGTNVICILEYLRSKYPLLYKNIHSYTIIDTSESLLELQKQRITEQFFPIDDDNNNNNAKKIPTIQYKLLNVSDVAEGQIPFFDETNHDNNSTGGYSRCTYIIALELFDNLPHDKIRVTRKEKQQPQQQASTKTTKSSAPYRSHEWYIEQAELCTATIVSNNKNSTNNNNSKKNDNGILNEEVFRPLSDPLLKHVLQIEPKYWKDDSSLATPTTRSTTSIGTSAIRWIPTIGCGLFNQIYKEQHEQQQQQRNKYQKQWTVHCIIADFDWLPLPDNFCTNSNSNKNSNDDNNHSKNTTTTTTTTTARKTIPSNDGSEPIITCMNGYDYLCYLNAPKYCDVLFPTNFDKLVQYLQKMFQQHRKKNNNSNSTIKTASRSPSSPLPFSSTCNGKSINSSVSADSNRNYGLNYNYDVQLYKQSEFLKLYGPNEVRSTTSWFTRYSPMIHDFSNCSIITTSRTIVSSPSSSSS